jgi:hypothetical protein
MALSLKGFGRTCDVSARAVNRRRGVKAGGI